MAIHSAQEEEERCAPQDARRLTAGRTGRASTSSRGRDGPRDRRGRGESRPYPGARGLRVSERVRAGVGVLCSGQGTNLQAILDAEARGELVPAKVRVVIANVPGVPALARAAKAGVKALVVDHRRPSRRSCAAFAPDAKERLFAGAGRAVVFCDR